MTAIENPDTSTEKFGRDHFNDFDLDSPEFNEHYTEVLDELVSKCPVAHSNVGRGYHVLSRYADVRRASQDWEHFSSAEGYQPNRPKDMAPIYPDECDPPYQTRWRRALDYHLSPRVVRSYEAAVTQHANFLIDEFIADGECDFIAGFAAALPGRAWFNSFLGRPLEDLPPLMTAIEHALVGPIEGRADGWAELVGYLDAHLKEREKEPPRNDLTGAVLKGVDLDEGVNPELGPGFEFELGAPCPWEHKVAALANLTAGGLGTATLLLAGMAHHLATHPEDRARLAENEELHDKAVEEFVRAYASVVAMSRTVRGEVEIAGQTFQDGDRVLLLYPAACRDPEMYENPTKLDIDRNLPVNAAFGFGPHRCIGSHLARLLAKVTLRVLLDRLPDFALAPGCEPTYQTSVTREIQGLRLIFEPGSPIGADL
ncbi:cytochrome P450 [Rhodococcus koreensis]|uniref:cytochrome P450 n=1 Tax=Rhodococcus koreensis TaxID=99653 RepID=UPI00366CDF37